MKEPALRASVMSVGGAKNPIITYSSQVLVHRPIARWPNLTCSDCDSDFGFGSTWKLIYSGLRLHQEKWIIRAAKINTNCWILDYMGN